MGIQMNEKELTKKFITISNCKNRLVPMSCTKIFQRFNNINDKANAMFIIIVWWREKKSIYL